MVRCGVLGALLVVGCGGGSGGSGGSGGGGNGSGGQCSGDVSCGGNVVGTWDITSTCESGNSSSSQQGCTIQNIDASNLHETGSITFNADLSYSVTFTVSGSVNETVGSSCLTMGTTSLTCADFSSALQTILRSDGGDTISSVSCQGAVTSCVCSFGYATTTMTESGTYTTSGAMLTTTSTTSTSTTSTTGPETQSYCVQGATMTVASGALGSMMNGMSAMTGGGDLRTQLTLKKR